MVSLNIGIVGAGLMGHSIALTLARVGHSVRIYDPMSESRATLKDRVAASLNVLGTDAATMEKCLANIEVADSVASAVQNANLVMEAAPEKLELKRQIFAEVEAHAPVDCVLASNTSVIQITKIVEQLRTRERALGTHWWNPAHMIPLVEVIRTEWTSDAALDFTMNLLSGAGKTPVRVEKDVPGFIGNRLQHALWREAISLVEKGICSAEAVDTVVKSSFGRRLSVLGPLENADLVGTDLALDVHNNILFDLENRQGPSPYLENLVQTGKLGMKSGEGFYTWSADEAKATRDRVVTHLQKLEVILPD